ncbi:MAG: hypothetical protein HY719_15815, partial [Planctomycetes bacterium]|nr:hypothetical protein [Planctomycetota bacterium]
MVVAVAVALLVLPIMAGCGKNGGPVPGAGAGAGGVDGQQAALRIERLITANEGGEVAAPAGHPLAGASVNVPRFALAQDSVISITPAPTPRNEPAPAVGSSAVRRSASDALTGALQTDPPAAAGTAPAALPISPSPHLPISPSAATPAALTGALPTAASLVAPSLPAGIAAVGPVVDFGPSGLSFAAPVDVTLPYSEGALRSLGLLDETRVAAFTIRSDTGKIEFLPVISRDTERDTVTVRADHFSLFGTTTEPNVGVLWRLVSTITSITLYGDGGEPVPAEYPDLTNFGDEDIDLNPGLAMLGVLSADDLNGNANPFSLRGSAVAGGAVAFTITGFGAAPQVVGGTVNGATSPARTDYAGSHAFTVTEDHGDQIVGSFTGGYDEVTYVDDAGVTRVGRVAYAGAFTVDVIRADDLEADDTVSNGLSPARGAAGEFVTCATQPIRARAFPTLLTPLSLGKVVFNLTHPGEPGEPARGVPDKPPVDTLFTGSPQTIGALAKRESPYLLTSAMADGSFADRVLAIRIIEIDRLIARYDEIKGPVDEPDPTKKVFRFEAEGKPGIPGRINVARDSEVLFLNGLPEDERRVDLVRYTAEGGAPADGSGALFTTRFAEYGQKSCKARLGTDPVYAEVIANVVGLKEAVVIPYRETLSGGYEPNPDPATHKRVARGESLLVQTCPLVPVLLRGVSEIAVDTAGGLIDPFAHLARYDAPGAVVESGAGPSFEARYLTPGDHTIKVHLSGDVGEAGGQKGWAEVTVRVAGFRDLVFDLPDACANQYFWGTLTFDADVSPDIVSHLDLEAVYLNEAGAEVEEPISVEATEQTGNTVKAKLYFTEFFGGGPRLIRVKCGAGEIERPFTKVGITHGELVDDDDPNRMITTEGPFEMTTFLGEGDPDRVDDDRARVTLTIETEPWGRESEFLFAFKPINGVMPPLGAFQPAPVQVTFAESGEFEITLKCAREDRIGAGVFEFGGGPIITVVDLVALTVTDTAPPAS